MDKPSSSTGPRGYHLQRDTGAATLCRKKGSCEQLHYSTLEEARAEHWKQVGPALESLGSSTSLGRSLSTEGKRWGIPQEIAHALAGYLVQQALTPLMVVPSGSILYNSHRVWPPKDFDFVVFIPEDQGQVGTFRHVLVGALDMFIVPLGQIETLVKSTQIPEAYLGGLRGYCLHREGSWDPRESIVRDAYRARLEESFEKHADGSYDEARWKREEKHLTRWFLYLERGPWGTSFDPRLTPAERSWYLKTLGFSETP